MCNDEKLWMVRDELKRTRAAWNKEVSALKAEIVKLRKVADEARGAQRTLDKKGLMFIGLHDALKDLEAE